MVALKSKMHRNPRKCHQMDKCIKSAQNTTEVEKNYGGSLNTTQQM